MNVSIIQHATTPHPDDDSSHPIPSLAVLDVVTILKGGGADLFIIIASPLQADHRSLTRLLNKIEGYLQHIASLEFQAEAGVPSSSNTAIIVRLHPGSASEVYDLLERSKPWVQDNDASLKVELLDVTLSWAPQLRRNVLIQHAPVRCSRHSYPFGYPFWMTVYAS